MGRNQSQGGSTNTGLMEATNGGQLVMGSLTLNNVGGIIQASGTGSSVTFADQGQGGQIITGGTYKTSGGGVINATNSTTTIDGTNGNTVTNLGTLLIPDQGAHPGAFFQGTLNNKGSFQLLSKGDSLGLNIPGGQTFTLMGTGSLTMGDGTDNAYNNQNFISGATFVNQQLVQGTGAILNLTGFNNSGIINANVPAGSNNLVLELGRAGPSTNTGTIEASNGGALLVGSTTINNVGGTFEAVGTGSYVDLVGSLGTSGLTITGGTFTSSSGGVIYGQGFSTLDGTTSPVNNSGTFILNDVNQNTSGMNAQGTFNNTGTIKILSTGDQVVLAIPGGQTLTLTGSGTVVMGDGTDNSYNSHPSIGSSLGTDGTFDNQSTIEGTGGIVLTANVINDGKMIANMPPGTNGLTLFIDRIGNIQNNGTIQATGGGVFYIGTASCCGNPFTNSGTVIADANSTVDLENANPFGNLTSGVLTGGAFTVTGTLQIPGNVTANASKVTLIGAASKILNPGSDALTGLLTNMPTGTFAISGGRNFTSSSTFTNQGAIKIGKGSTFTVPASATYMQTRGQTVVDGKLTVASTDDLFMGADPESATVTGTIKIAKGSVFGNGGNLAANVISGGTITPADSPILTGKLKITGNYNQTATGALDANIAAAASGQFNVLNVANSATLGGTMNNKLLNNFVPLIGATFQILTARRVEGTFATVTGTAINSNEHFTVTYNSTNVTLEVVSGP